MFRWLLAYMFSKTTQLCVYDYLSLKDVGGLNKNCHFIPPLFLPNILFSECFVASFKLCQKDKLQVIIQNFLKIFFNFF